MLLNIKYGDIDFVDEETGEPTETMMTYVGEDDDGNMYLLASLFGDKTGEVSLTFVFATEDEASHNVNVKIVIA
jgi:hypothetical protein